ncbi:MAG: hypothetical protein AAB788_00660 [Patescibacteria group bacterium]
MLDETIGSTDPNLKPEQKVQEVIKGQGKSSKPSLWTDVNVDQMEKLAAGLEKYEAKKKAAVAPKKKKGK